SRPHATVTSWTSPRFDGSKGYPPKGYYYNCSKSAPFYVSDAAWSPDDKTVYLATTGYRPFNANSVPLKGLGDWVSCCVQVDELRRLRFAVHRRRRQQRGLLRRSRAVVREPGRLRQAGT